jgi:hypothetical protein
MRKARLLGAGTLTLLAMLSMTAVAGASKGTVEVLTPSEPEPGVTSYQLGEPGQNIYQLMFVEVRTNSGFLICAERLREELLGNSASSVSLNAFAAGPPSGAIFKGCRLGLIKTPGIALSANGTVKLKGAFEATLNGCVYKFSHIATAPLMEAMEFETTATATLVPKLSWAKNCEAVVGDLIVYEPAEVEEPLVETLVQVHVNK